MARSPKGAGPLIERVAFAERTLIDDGYGNLVAGDFVEKFQQQAGFIYLRGNEAVDAARMNNQQAVVIRTRVSDDSREITSDWQARDVRRGTLFNIRSITTDPSRSMFELLCETGVATG